MNRKLEILLVEDDPAACKEIAGHVDDSDDLILIGVTSNSTNAVELIKDKLPDAVILDLELNLGGGSGLAVLNGLNALSLPRKPYILITTNNSSAVTYEAARQLGADFIMSKHQEGYSAKSVLDFLRIMKSSIQSDQRSSIIQENTTETPEQYNRRITRRITRELDYVGINPRSIGYTYLTEAIQIMMKQHTQNISSIIAEKYNKSESSVERAMQNAINRAWKTSNIEDLLQHYTAKINSAKGNPTITEFICYYANKLKMNIKNRSQVIYA